jgi:DNA-binding transcriptional regulator LsrR (DeoR family)
MKIPYRIGIASGMDKVEAILGGIRSYLINVLIRKHDISEALVNSKVF